VSLLPSHVLYPPHLLAYYISGFPS
jgi:hypothetical protein